MVDLLLSGLRVYIVLLSIINAVCALRFRNRTKQYKGFAIIAAVVPLEWVIFYVLRALHAVQPIALNAASIFITAQTLTFLFAFILFASEAIYD